MYKSIFILLLAPVLTVAQSVDKNIVDSLKYVADMPYICESELPYDRGCGSKIFWRAVQQKETIIPLLIDKIADTTTTQAFVLYFGGQHTVGDVAYFALQEIIDGIPTFELLGIKFDSEGCGFCSYWNHLRSDIENRRKFRQAVGNWYKQNKSKLIWVPSGNTSTRRYKEGMFRVKQ